MAFKKKPVPLAKVVQFYKGFDLMGAQASSNHRKADIEIYDWGVRIISKKNKRVIRVYAGNIQGLEELPQDPHPLADDELE